MIRRKTCSISMSERHLKRLEELSEEMSMNRSVVIQLLIDKEYESRRKRDEKA